MLKYYFVQVASLIVLIALVITMKHGYEVRSKHKERMEELVRDVHKTKSEIRSARHHEVRLNNSFPVWQELYNTRVYPDNEQSTGESLDSMIRRLCELNKVSVEELEISGPIDVSSRYQKQYIKVENIKVSMKFSALTDKHAVLFMRSIKYDIPGFVSMKLFEVVKGREVTQEVIESNKSGAILPTVEGNIAFELYRISGLHV